MKDMEYKDIIKQKLHIDENDFISNSNYNKNMVWDRINSDKKVKKIIPIWLYYAAASIAVVLLFNFWTFNTIQNKNTEILVLKNEIEKNKSIKEKNIIKYVHETIIDTVFVEQQVVKYLTKTKYDTIKITEFIATKELKTIHDTIYIIKYINNIIEDKEIIALNDSVQINNKVLFARIKNFTNNLKKNSKRDKINFRFFKPDKKEERYTDNTLKITLK